MTLQPARIVPALKALALARSVPASTPARSIPNSKLARSVPYCRRTPYFDIDAQERPLSAQTTLCDVLVTESLFWALEGIVGAIGGIDDKAVTAATAFKVGTDIAGDKVGTDIATGTSSISPFKEKLRIIYNYKPSLRLHRLNHPHKLLKSHRLYKIFSEKTKKAYKALKSRKAELIRAMLILKPTNQQRTLHEH